MTLVIDTIDTYFFSEVDPFPYAVLRIAIGILYFLTALDFIVSYDICAPTEEGGYYNSRRISIWNVPNIFKTFNCPFWLYILLYFICSIAITIGFFSTTFFILILYLVISKRAFMNEVHCGSDQLLQYFSLWMIFANSDQTLSVMSLLFENQDGVCLAYAGRCMTINFAMFYSLSVIAKLQGRDWRSGVAVWNAMNFPDRHCWKWPVNFLSDKIFLAKFSTYFVLFFEGTAIVGFVYKPLIPVWATALFMMHLGIEITMFVGLFGWMACTFLTFLFLTYLYW